MLTRGLAGARPTVYRMAMQTRGMAMSPTTALLRDKRTKDGREFKIRKVHRKNDNDGDTGEDMEEVVSRLVEGSKELDEEMDVMEEEFEASLNKLLALSKGGTAGLEVITIDGKRLPEIASISSHGIQATVNVYHQPNVLKVKSAIEDSVIPYKTKMGMSSTTIAVILPKMTRERREQLTRTVKEKLHEHRTALFKAQKHLEHTYREDISKLNTVQHRDYMNDIHAAEKDASKHAEKVANEVTDQILSI